MSQCCEEARPCERHLDEKIKAVTDQQREVDAQRDEAVKKVEAWHEKKWAALDKEWDRLVALRYQLWAEDDARRDAEKIANAGKAVAHA